jgi:hypothetical protein
MASGTSPQTSIASALGARGYDQGVLDILNAIHASMPSFLEASAVADVASIAFGAEAVQAITVPGAALGDYCQVSIVDTPASGSLADASLMARVSAADTVTLTISNLHAATALDLSAAAVFRVLVTKKGTGPSAGKTFTL